MVLKKTILTTLCCSIIVIMLSGLASATSYYYCQGNGTDGSDAADCSTPALACKTIVDANTKTLTPGDSMLFCRGGTWRVTTDAYPTFDNGNSTANVTYGAYGTGNKPLFLGSVNASAAGNWTNTSATIWKTTFNNSNRMGQIYANATVTNGIVNAITPTRDLTPDAQGDWFWNNTDNKMTMYSTSNPATYYNQGVEIGIDANEGIFSFNSGDYITFQNLELRYGSLHGFTGVDTTHINVFNNTVQYVGGGGSTTRLGNCIELGLGSDHSYMTYNYVKDCYDAGITQQSWETNRNIYNNYIGYNVIVNCAYGYETFNEQVGGRIENTTLDHNTIVNSGAGFAVTQTEGNGGRSLRLAETTVNSAEVVARDNILYNSTFVLIDKSISWIGAAPSTDYNVFYKTNTNYNRWDGTYYTTLAAFTSATGQEVHGNSTTVANSVFGGVTTGNYTPIGNYCNASSTGSYVGALPCASAETTTNTTTASSFKILGNAVFKVLGSAVVRFY